MPNDATNIGWRGTTYYVLPPLMTANEMPPRVYVRLGHVCGVCGRSFPKKAGLSQHKRYCQRPDNA